jgi:hypothetical protein
MTNILALLVLLQLMVIRSYSFVSPAAVRKKQSSATLKIGRFTSRQHDNLSALWMSSYKLSTPSQDESVALGIREWPQQVKSGSWSENVRKSETLTRYVLEGTGIVIIITEYDRKTINISTGSLLEVTGPTSLEWKAGTAEMIILTPGYEEGGKFVFVAAMLFLLTGALVSGLL